MLGGGAALGGKASRPDGPLSKPKLVVVLVIVVVAVLVVGGWLRVLPEVVIGTGGAIKANVAGVIYASASDILADGKPLASSQAIRTVGPVVPGEQFCADLVVYEYPFPIRIRTAQGMVAWVTNRPGDFSPDDANPRCKPALMMQRHWSGLRKLSDAG